MNNKKLILIVALSITALFFVLKAEESNVDKSETYKVKKGDNVSINLTNGDILVKSWNKDEVMIQIIDGDVSSNNYKVEQKDNYLRISYNGSWKWDSDNNFIVTLPPHLMVDLRTGGGDIRIEDELKAAVRASTNSGDISSKMIQGNVQFMSQGGDILSGEIDGNFNANTMGGDIIVSDVKGNCNLNTKGGDIKTKNVTGNLQAVTSGGDIIIESVTSSLFATTYGGDIKVESANGNSKLVSYAGDVVINKSKGDIEVEASAGDIRLRESEGSVKLNSLSGDIWVVLNPKGASSIKSNFGDIELSIPSNAKVNISALAKTAFDDEELIISDFENFVKDQKTKNGHARKEYSINGGGNASIDIKTNNAKILIKKK